MGESSHRKVEGHRSRIVIIGAGNVASHLAPALDAVSHVETVWSRDIAHAAQLADTLTEAHATDSLTDIPADADFYIVAVTDDAITDVCRRMPRVNGIVAHTSGSMPLTDMAAALPEGVAAGVFYPLQTFSRETDVDLCEVPFLIEGTDSDTIAQLTALAGTISRNVHPVDSTTRGELHVAAVFANNFANYMWTVADRYLQSHTEFDIAVFKPLLAETLHKAMTIGPDKAQTGPARRGDKKIIAAHIDKLNDADAEIYRLVSQRIFDQYKK